MPQVALNIAGPQGPFDSLMEITSRATTRSAGAASALASHPLSRGAGA